MKTSKGPRPDSAVDPELLAIHLVCALSAACDDGRRAGLDELANGVGGRRSEVRGVLSALHRQGFVDVVRMRPTLAGFAIARAFARQSLKPLRSAAKANIAAA
jgi:hypothetical protein